MRVQLAIVLSVCALCAGHLIAAPSREDAKTAKVNELVQLRGLAGMMAQFKAAGFDQDDALRAWERFYSEGLTERELDAILAYYRSPAGVDDVRASQAALARVQQYMLEKQNAGTNAAVENHATDSPQRAGAPTPSAGSNPSAPDGKVIANSVSNRCEAAPSAAAPANNAPATGRSVLCVCIDENGKLTQDPVIAESSGDARVDKGAVKLARVNSGRYTPPTLDGKPQKGCFRYAVNFRHPE